MLSTRTAVAGGAVSSWRSIATRVAPAPSGPDHPGPARGGRRLSETEVGARLLRRLDAARARPSGETIGALRASVTELADRMRALDLPLARVTAALETMLREHGVPWPQPTLEAGGPRATHAAVSPTRLLDWCAHAYHDDDWW